MDPESLLSFLIDHGRLWVRSQRDLYHPSARAFSQAERSALSGFFDPDILDRARIIIVPVIENPSFYSDLEQMGLSAPLDFTTMTGISVGKRVAHSSCKSAREIETSEGEWVEGIDPVVYGLKTNHGFSIGTCGRKTNE